MQASSIVKISVVTVCLNAEQTIRATIRSFLMQTHFDKELLIIDGKSRDATLDAVQEFSSPTIRVISEKDGGIYDAMNKGLSNFSGDAVGFLNADDAFHDPFAIGRIAGALKNADAVYGDMIMVRDHVSRQVVREWKAGVPAAFRQGWMPPHPTFYVRRTLAQATGLFDLSYRISSDYDFMLRAMELHGARAAYIPHTLVNFMIGGKSTSGLAVVILGNLECLRARRKHLHTPVVDAALFMKPLRKLRQLRQH